VKQIQFNGPGDPVEVVTCVDAAEPSIEEPGQVLVRVDLFPINPADLFTMRGQYVRPDPTSPRLGVEATGLVAEVGAEVTDVKPGDRVVLLGTDLWSEFVVADRRDVVRVAPATPVEFAATLKVNPATAALLLSEFAPLVPGDWLVQNAANSAVGTAIDRIARDRGLNVVNLVRRPELLDELDDRPVVLLDREDVTDRITEATAGSPVKLALDAVMGESGSRLMSVVADHAPVVIYGAMSGAPMQVGPVEPIFRDVQLQGFWLTRWLAEVSIDRRTQLYRELEDMALRLDLAPPITSTFPATDVAAAVARASEIGATGKVAVRF
jgi:NADPH:quinone reductase-like Zn-dependent oxidoreductase